MSGRDNQDRAGRFVEDAVGGAADEEIVERGVSVGTHHDVAGFFLCGDGENGFHGGAELLPTPNRDVTGRELLAQVLELGRGDFFRGGDDFGHVFHDQAVFAGHDRSGHHVK